jgi:hypothetical protein
MNSSHKPPGQHTRITVNAPVEISAVDIEGRAISTKGLAINLSRSGACLRLGFESPLGAIVAIRWQDELGSYETLTRLRWKQERDGHWQVGVEALDQTYLWSKLFQFISAKAPEK